MESLLRFSFGIMVLAALDFPLSAAEYGLMNGDRPTVPLSSGPVPRTTAIIADATLHDVCCVGRQCWAVGERGTILRSHDRGETWTTEALQIDCSLQSVFFLTDRIGFAAGFALDAVNQRNTGVLLATADGGTNWTTVPAEKPLPGLRGIRFFDLENGYAVTTASEERGGQLLRTGDGGQSWSIVSSDAEFADWKSISFLNLLEGIVVGQRQATGLVNDGRLVPQRYPRRTLQAVNAATLSNDGRAWQVGDGGFILTSTNRGVAWKPPIAEFPPAVRDVFRFRTVVHYGNKVCVAGTPGSSVLKSDDSGASWITIPCGSGGSIARMIHVGGDSLLAVGSWGRVIRSDNFGDSWRTVRNPDLRSAIMYMVTDPADTSAVALASLAADDGYRVAAVQLSQQRTAVDRNERWAAAYATLGVNGLESDWRFARTRLGHGSSRDALVSSWNAASDGRLRELLSLRMAVQLRTWRPTVVCIESAGQIDGVADVWQSALADAMSIAAGTHSQSATLDALNIPAWTIQRAIRRVHSERTPLSYAPNQLLPHLGTTAGLLAASWHSLTGIPPHSHDQATSYRQIHPDQATTPNAIFDGITLRPGSEARRELAYSNANLKDLKQLVRRHHTQQSAVTGQLIRSPLGTELIAHTQTLGQDLPPALALAQLQHLNQLYEDSENLEGRIAVLQELTRRVPDSAVAANAAAELHMIYSSSEILALREQEGATPGASDNDRDGAVVPATGPFSVQPIIRQVDGVALNGIKPTRGSAEDAQDRQWHRQAELSWNLLNRLSPSRANSGTQLLIKAARYRRHGKPSDEQTTLARAAGLDGDAGALATNEMQATFSAATPTLTVHNLPQTESRPKLDALLDDACWETAPEVLLKDNQGGTSVDDTLLMISWDTEYLFLAGHMPIAGGQLPLREALDRSYDEADTAQDHIAFAFDVDRDYSTGWHLTIDSSGRTADSCWKITRWNPEWFVATRRNEVSWQFEAAIPVHELQDKPLKAGQLWAMQARRIVPGFADQQTTVSESGLKLASRYDMLRFIRNRRSQR